MEIKLGIYSLAFFGGEFVTEFYKELIKYQEYCYEHVCNSWCQYYKYYLDSQCAGPTACMCRYILDRYDVINIERLELMTTGTLESYFMYCCKDRSWFTCNGQCSRCKINMLEKDQNIIVKRREN